MDKKKPDKILEKLEEYFAPVQTAPYERYLFHSAQQQQNETIDQYIICLQHLASNCKFGTLHDEILRDRLVLGCRDKGARARLFREKECSLKKALESLQISEAIHEQLKDIGGEENPIPVSAVYHKRSAKKGVQFITHIPACKYCGGKHKPARTKCPAYGKTCRNCGKANHFYIVCLQGKINAKQISVVQESQFEESESEDELFMVKEVGTVTQS